MSSQRITDTERKKTKRRNFFLNAIFSISVKLDNLLRKLVSNKIIVSVKVKKEFKELCYSLNS